MAVLGVNASYGAVSISPSKTTVNPGDQFTVTVTASGVAAWDVHVNVEGPVSGGGTIRLVGDSSDGQNTSASTSATFTAIGTGTIRFYTTSSTNTTANQNGEGVRAYPSASASVNVVEKQEAPATNTSTNTTKPANTTKPGNATKPAETKPSETKPTEEEEVPDGPSEADFEAAQVVINLIHMLDKLSETFAEDVAAARGAYEELTDAQKELVLNYEALLLAEEELLKDKVEEEPEELEEKQKRKPVIVSMPLAAFIGLQAGIILIEVGVILGLQKYMATRGIIGRKEK